MCGLVAILSKSKSGFFFKDKAIFMQMLIADMFRGMDSTGCFAVNKFGNLNSIKDASSASFFMNKKDSSDFFNKFTSDHHIVVGHNRKATMGVVTSENAHPFIEGNICLVHNGTLTNHRKLANRTVDSNAIAAHIEEHGYKSMLKNIEGAYALIWYNAAEKNLYFCRNAERPLYLVETATNIYLASENKMLDWILDRNDIGKYSVQNVPTDKVFKFNLDTRKLEAESKPKKETTPVKQQQFQWQSQKYQSTSGVQQQSHSGNLALVHSSASTTPAASIETYTSGEQVTWRILDWENREGSVKLVGETTDNLKTPVSMFLVKDVWPQKDIDNLITKEYVTGTISSISSKHGLVRLWLKTVEHEPRWTTGNHVKISPGQLQLAGGCCYQCGEVLNTKEQIAGAHIEVNSQNEIQYVTCEFCVSTPWNQMHQC